MGAGEYAPETRSGRGLLAHELTHVVQQTPLTARRKPLIQRAPEASPDAATPPSPASEAEPEPPTESRVEEPERAPAAPEPAPETPTPTETAAPGLIVEDDAAEVGPDQMKKSDFFAELRTTVCASADEAMVGTENTAQACPWIELSLRFYERQSAERVERDLVSFAPEAAGVTSVRDYIPLIADRVHQSVEVWVTTGEITGVPRRLPGLSIFAGLGGALAGVGGMFFKARSGGPRSPTNPRAVQAQLGAGRPLPGSVRSRMGSAFGGNFSGVRVHTDAAAAGLSGRFNARAFTVGEHVAFGSGQYRPGTLVGDVLIAHELAHVVQQEGASTSVSTLQPGGSGYGALEHDADRSAVGVVASLSGSGAERLASIAGNARPRLRSGLRLQRCGFFRSLFGGGTRPAAAPTAPSAGAEEEAPPGEELSLPEVECSPTAVPLAEVTRAAAAERGPEAEGMVLGYTKPADFRASVGALFYPDDGTCKIKYTAPTLSFDHFVYARQGTYRVRGEKRAAAKCRGRSLPLHMTITSEMSEKIGKAEIEHCEDAKRAFALTGGRLNRAAKEVEDEGPFPAADVDSCQREVNRRLSSKLGVRYPDKFSEQVLCLFTKTQLRDPPHNDWHVVDLDIYSERRVDRRCRKVTHTLDHTRQLPELDDGHPPSEIIKDCGE